MGLPYGPPDIYLGTHICKHQHPYDDSDSFCYTISGNHYMNNAVSNVQKKLMYHVRDLSAK